jgi:3-dehydroquinate synthase
MQDPTEKKIFVKVKFWSYAGHAIESYFLENDTKITLLHGEAIAAGMVLESFISLHKT